MSFENISELVQAAGVLGFLAIGTGIIIYFFIFRGYGQLMKGYEKLVEDERQQKTNMANEYIKSINNVTIDNRQALTSIVNRFEQAILEIKNGNDTQAKHDMDFAEKLKHFGEIIYDMAQIQKDIKILLVELLNGDKKKANK